MAFIQYLTFDGEDLPLPDSYEVGMEDKEADSGGETEAGTIQRDVVRAGVVEISVTFSVTPKWIKKLTEYKQQRRSWSDILTRKRLSRSRPRCMWTDSRASWRRIRVIRGCGR